jgi:protein-S-isoprenylcysteine O-methyltransferase Ste14
MQDNRPDRPDVITLPPLILAATIALGVVLNFLARGRAAQQARSATSGVFRKSRNPIYLGMLLLCAGVAFLANSLWILVLVLPLAIILQKGVIKPE